MLTPSPLGRRYGRNIPDPLPPHRMLLRAEPNLPNAVDLRPWCGPVKDQGDEGSCTAHAGTSGREWVVRRYFPKHGSLVFSPQYTYAQELLAQGDFPRDVGSDGTTLCHTLIANGCCEEALYPYVAGGLQKPTPEQDANARTHTMGAYHGLTDYRTCLSVLGDPVPWPVMIGFTVYESFENGDWWASGVMPVPKPDELVLGGHEALIVGYDMASIPTIRPAGCPPAVLIQNSWGKSWALGGFFWMPFAVLNDPETDMKIAHTGHPWVPKANG